MMESSLEEQARLAGLIVVGDVTAVRTQPTTDSVETLVTVTVEDTLKGTQRSEVTVTLPGGEYDGRRLVVGGVPNFAGGERVLLFLRGDGDTRLVQLWQSKYSLTGPEAIQQESGRRTQIDEIERRLSAALQRPIAIADEPPGRIISAYQLDFGCSWFDDEMPVSFAVNPANSGTANLGSTTFLQMVYESLNVWQAVPNSHIALRVSEITSAPVNINVFDAQESVGWDDLDWLGPGTLGVTTCKISGNELDVDVAIDNESPWDTNDANGIAPGTVSVWETIEHEFGHAIGLAHTNVGCGSPAASLMCPGATAGTRVFLGSDDVNGVAALYPLSGPAPGVPAGLTVSSAASAINLQWSPSSGSKLAYDIERSTTGCGGAFRSAGTVPGNTTSFSDNNFGAGIPGGSLCYRVKALGPGGDSGYSTAVAVAAPASISATPNPCTLSGGICSTTITWSASFNARVTVQDAGGGPEGTFAEGSSGSQAAPWIQGAPHEYVFRLYDISGPSPVFRDSVTVTATPGGGEISASPNPCAIASGQAHCTSTISWSASGPAEVTVQLGNGPEGLFAAGASGSAPAPWIGTGDYVFRLYEIVNGSPVLRDSVTVTGIPSAVISASPNPCTIPPGQGHCASTITWTAPGPAEVTVQLGNGPEGLFAGGASGSAAAPWIGTGQYVFRLYEIVSGSRVFRDSVTVRGQ
jgi:hypothetical protein